jgi:L-asparaginase
MYPANRHEGRLVPFSRAPLRWQHLDLPDRLARVDLIAMEAGSDGRSVRAAADTGAEAVVIEAYARSKGVSVVIATKVYNGRALPVYGFKGGGATMTTLSTVFADDLTRIRPEC